jgi:N-acetylmuramoyl-L-alanine amidase/putative methionine-R-sulfoxide reductase with GAF domain
MATNPTKPAGEGTSPFAPAGAPARPRGQAPASSAVSERPGPDRPASDSPPQKPSQRNALQGLLAFSALHEQVRRRKALAARHKGFDVVTPVAEFEPEEFFVLDEVLQLVAERAVAITGADGLAIALADNDEIVLRASAGTVKPDVGARIDRDSAFSGASFRTAQVVNCDDTEVDPRVNLQACRRLGARSMVAVPLCGRRRVIGLLEAFSSWPFGFNDSDVSNLTLLAELIVGALKPEDEDRFADSAQTAVTKLQTAPRPVVAPQPTAPPQLPPPKPVTPAVTPIPKSAPAAVAPPIAVPQPVPAKPPAAAVAAPKPAQVEAASARTILAPLSASLEKPAVEKAPEITETPAAQPAPLPAPTFGQLEPERATHRPGVLILLVCIVVTAAIAGGVWWKWKTAQLGSLIVQTERTEPKPVETDASNYIAPPSPTAGTITNPAPAANPAASAVSETGEPVLTPATPQELAKFPKVTGVRHWSSADSSTVVLDLEDQVQYEAHRLAGPDRIYFDLHDTQLVPDLIGKSIEVGDALLNRIRVAQPVAGMTRVVLEIRPDTNFSVSLEPNPYRLVVEVRKIGAAPKGAVNLFPNGEAEKNKVAIVVPPPTREDLQLRARVPKMRIVVDAGHGGWDLGTVGRKGLLEKDLVLEIAQRLGKLLESRLGSEVILTRNDDSYIPLDDRAAMANQAQADLFVSVHANYSDLTSARGVETYYTNSFSAPGSNEAGSKESGPKDADAQAKISGTKPAVTPSLTPAELHDRVEQSRRLAASVQRSLYGTLSTQNPGLRDRGIKSAGFVVLTESAMPGILAEVSFVSSPTDEQKLQSDHYREEIAEALYKGIARYAASSKGVKVASAAK